MQVQVIPQGPLHPEIAWASLGVGAAVTGLVVLHSRRADDRDPAVRALVASMLASLTVTAVFDHDPWTLVRRMGSHARWSALVATLAIGGALAIVDWAIGRRVALLLGLMSLAVAWATVPDTEVSLALGLVTLPPIALTCARRRHDGAGAGAVTVAFGIATGGATGLGARGQPERIWFTIVVAAGGCALALIVRAVCRSATKRTHPVDGGA